MKLKVKIENNSKLVQGQLFDLGFLWDTDYLPNYRNITNQYICIDTVLLRMSEVTETTGLKEFEKPLLWSIEGIYE